MEHVSGARDDDRHRALGTDAAFVSQAPPAEDDRDVSRYIRQAYVLGNGVCGRSLVSFVAESCIVYPAAHHLALFHLETRAMEFLHPVRQIKSVQCFTVSPNRELLAVAEVWHTVPTAAGGQHAPPSPSKVAVSPHSVAAMSMAASMLREQEQRVVSIYNVATRTRVRTIVLQANVSVASCDFSTDNKFLVVLEDAPTHNVTYWKVSNAKLVASSKSPSRGTRVHIHPGNASFLSVSGPSILKYWIWTNREFRIGNFLPMLRDQEHFVDHVWLRHYMVAVSERGLLLVFRSSGDMTGVDLAHSSRCHQPSYVRLECLAAHSKGFVVGGSAGFFSVYEASEDAKDPFPFVRSVSVGEIAFDCLAVSPNSELLVACSKSRELLQFPMSVIDTEQEDQIEYSPLLRQGNQVGAVWHVDACAQRSVIATCGADKTVRIWNTDVKAYEVVHVCAEEPVALTLHPSGFQVVVAFKERTRVFHVLHASLRQARELAIKACKFVRYSHGGHIFACAAGLTVRIYRSYTAEVLHTLSGHIGAVRHLTFSSDDTFIYSAGHDGAIYRWSAGSGSRCEDMLHVAKQCHYSSFVVDGADFSIVVAAGNDSRLREIVGGEETHVVDLLPGTNVTALALTRDNRRLFAGTSVGSVQIYAWPLRGRHLTECYVQTEAVTSLRITDVGDNLLISSSEDASVCLFRILDSFGQSSAVVKLEEETSTKSPVLGDRKRLMSTASAAGSASSLVCDAVLVAREDLEDKDTGLTEMQRQYAQLKADVEFALHRKENEWVDRLHAVKEESERLMMQERARFEELEGRHQVLIRRHAEELAQIEASHVKMTQELENQYERKLAHEVTRFDALSETLELTRQRCESLVESQDAQHRGALHAERKAAYSRSKEQNDIIKRLHDDLNYNHAKFEEVLRQEESDYEVELHRLRAEHEKQLDQERQTTAIKQGQLSAVNTKLESMKKKMQELKASSLARDVLLATERAKVSKLEATLATFEEHFEVGKVAMNHKDKAIAGLQSSNRVLESFRSVLSHRIDNLEKEKAPIVGHLSQLESHISGMQTEMADEYKLKAEIQQDLEAKEAKVRLLLNEVKALRQSALKKEYSVGEMTREFARLAQISNLKDLASAVKDAYRVFVIGEAAHKKVAKPLLSMSLAGQDAPDADAPPSVSKQSQLVSASPKKVAAFPAKGKHGEDCARATTASSLFKKRQDGAKPPPQEMAATMATDDALGYDTKQAVNESVKQMEYMSRIITTLRAALDNANAKADRIRRDSVAEGSQLIEECNKLRKENKTLLLKIRDLERCLNGFGCAGQPSPSSSRPMTPSPSSPLISTRAANGERLTVDDASTSDQYKLLPLSGATSSKHKGSAGNTLHSPSPTRKGNRSALPFTRIEMERDMRSGLFAKAEELTATIERQKREIQRLQAQVQLLLSEGPSDPAAQQGTKRGATAVDLAQSLPVSARSGMLRPLSSSEHSRPLQPTVVLTPAPLQPTFVLTPGQIVLPNAEVASNQDTVER